MTQTVDVTNSLGEDDALLLADSLSENVKILKAVILSEMKQELAG